MTECEEFDGFLAFQQSAPYAAAVLANGARVRWLDGDVGPVLAVERGRLRLILRGPVHGSPPDQARALRRLARWPGITIATPESAVQGFGLVPIVTPMHHVLWALGPDLRARLGGKWRNRLVAAERAGVEVQPAGAASLDRLIAEEAVQRQQRRYRSLPASFTRGLPAQSFRLWDWHHQGDCAAAMAFVVHGSCATYHLGWASDRARQAGVHAVMLLQAAEALRAEGVRWLDLGSIDTDRAPGLARFKLGTGAALKRLGPTVLVLP